VSSWVLVGTWVPVGSWVPMGSCEFLWVPGFPWVPVGSAPLFPTLDPLVFVDPFAFNLVIAFFFVFGCGFNNISKFVYLGLVNVCNLH